MGLFDMSLYPTSDEIYLAENKENYVYPSDGSLPLEKGGQRQLLLRRWRLSTESALTVPLHSGRKLKQVE